MAASVAVPARADVYAWKDKDGRLVVSDRPGGPGVQHATYSVRGVETIRTTRLDWSTLTAPNRLPWPISPCRPMRSTRLRACRDSGLIAWTRGPSLPKAVGLMHDAPTATELASWTLDPAQNIKARAILKRLLYWTTATRTALRRQPRPGAVENTCARFPYRETRRTAKIVSVTEVGWAAKVTTILELVTVARPRYSDPSGG